MGYRIPKLIAKGYLIRGAAELQFKIEKYLVRKCHPLCDIPKVFPFKALDALISDIKLIIFVKVEDREYLFKFDKDHLISAWNFESAAVRV